MKSDNVELFLTKALIQVIPDCKNLHITYNCGWITVYLQKNALPVRKYTGQSKKLPLLSSSHFYKCKNNVMVLCQLSLVGVINPEIPNPCISCCCGLYSVASFTAEYDIELLYDNVHQ